MTNTMYFQDKLVVIDGAASGIGLETAIILSRQGTRVVLIDMDEKKLEKAQEKLEGNGHLILPLNLSELESIEPSVQHIVSECGKIDGFVHCVGIRSRRPIKMLKPDTVQQVISVNFISFVELVQCITLRNHFNPGLSIVGISSISAKSGGAAITAYAASKAAMDGAVRCLAKELAPKQIRINTVMPGQINTPAYSAIMDGTNGEDPVLQRQYLGLGEACDVANTICFLLSNESRLITGAALPLDGGFFTS